MSILFRAHHVSLTVENMERSVSFYEGFGFTVAYTYSSSDGERRISHLRLDEFLLELFEFKNRFHAEPTSNREIFPVGIRHFALEVVSAVDAHNSLTSAGITCDELKTGTSGLRYFFVRDPDGIWFEVVEDNRRAPRGFGA